VGRERKIAQKVREEWKKFTARDPGPAECSFMLRNSVLQVEVELFFPQSPRTQPGVTRADRTQKRKWATTLANDYPLSCCDGSPRFSRPPQPMLCPLLKQAADRAAATSFFGVSARFFRFGAKSSGAKIEK
jgi:hypothetical protein